VLSRPVYRMPPHGNAAVAIHRRASPGLHSTVLMSARYAVQPVGSRISFGLYAILDATLWAVKEGGAAITASSEA